MSSEYVEYLGGQEAAELLPLQHRGHELLPGERTNQRRGQWSRDQPPPIRDEDSGHVTSLPGDQPVPVGVHLPEGAGGELRVGLLGLGVRGVEEELVQVRHQGQHVVLDTRLQGYTATEEGERED